MNSQSANLVSVVITCYNLENHIGDAIKSVLAQTYPSFEVIVVDDGSTDGSWDVARSFSDVRCFRQKHSGTPAATRNRGLQESRGNYVTFLDGDDRLLPKALEIGVRHLQSDPDCAFAAGRCYAISNGQRSLSTLPSTGESDQYRALLSRNYILTPGSVIFLRAVLDELKGFDTSLEIKGSEDYDMYLRVAARWPIYYHEDMVLEYRQHESSLSKNAERMLISSLTVLRSQEGLIKQNESHKEAYKRGITFWREFYGEQVVESIRDHVRDRAWRQALSGIKVLIQYCPQLLARHAIRKMNCVLFRIRSDRTQPE